VAAGSCGEFAGAFDELSDAGYLAGLSNEPCDGSVVETFAGVGAKFCEGSDAEPFPKISDFPCERSDTWTFVELAGVICEPAGTRAGFGFDGGSFELPEDKS